MKMLSRGLAVMPAAALLFALSTSADASTPGAAPGGSSDPGDAPYKFDDGTTTVTVVTTVDAKGNPIRTRTSTTKINCSAGTVGCRMNDDGEFELVER